MTTTLTLEQLEKAEDIELGEGPWVKVEQDRIQTFADATGDHQWIHVDPEMAAKGPFGTTVAHGYLTLSLLPSLLSNMIEVSGARMGVNYGIDRMRFTAPVPSGSEVRLKAKIKAGERRGDGILYKVGVEMEVKGQDKPALVGEVLYLVF